MPTLASANRTGLTWKKEGDYPTNYGVVQGGNGTNLRMTGESLDFTTQTETSKEIRSDRQVSDLVLVGASASGGFNFELSSTEYDEFLQSTLQGAFVHYGTLGKSAAFTGALTFAATTITNAVAPTGNDAFTILKKGQWFKLNPLVGSPQAVKDYFNSRVFRVSTTVAPTATMITLDAATPINTTVATTAMAAGATISSSTLVNGVAMSSYSLELQYADIVQFALYLGMIPSKMSLSAAPGSIVTGSFDFMGKNSAISGVSQMGSANPSQTFTPINAVSGVFDVFEGSTLAALSATTFVKSFKIDIDNKLRGQTAVGVFGNAGIASGTLDIKGSLEVYFANATLYQKFISNQDSSIVLPLLDPSGNGYVIVVPRIKFGSCKITSGSLDTDVMASMDFTGILDVSTDAAMVSYQKSIAIFKVKA